MSIVVAVYILKSTSHQQPFSYKAMFFHVQNDAKYPTRSRENLLEMTVCVCVIFYLFLQSTLVISKSKGPSKTVRDIRTSTYQICSIEEKTI